MASDETIRALIAAIAGLRQDMGTLIKALELDRLSSTPPTDTSKNNDSFDTKEHDICNKLALYLHYYHLVREEAKTRKVRINSISRKSLFAYMYQAYNPADYNLILNSNGKEQTSFEASFNMRLRTLFSRQMNENTKMVPFFEGELTLITPERAAEAFIADLAKCRCYVSYNDFVQVIRDVLK